MKFLYDFFPILLFFIAYKLYDIYVATAVIIAASVLQISLYWIKNRRVEKMHLITLVLILILGSATLYLRNPEFIYWKPTIVNWAFALAFLGSQFIGKKNLLQRMLDSQITVTSQHIWKTLNFAWVGFFIAMGFINWYVFKHFSEDTWVNFKLFGMMGLTFVFVIAQGFYLMRYIVADDEEQSPQAVENEGVKNEK
ncbi:MAG: septation protein A [Candidatus Parabeggiatoa sp.]|nr:septation protein A [Candidatus Parabeggiatoa sp.]